MTPVYRLLALSLILGTSSSLLSCSKNQEVRTAAPQAAPTARPRPRPPLPKPPVPLVAQRLLAPGVVWKQFAGKSPRWHQPLFANVIEFDPLDSRYRLAVVPARGAPPSFRESTRRIALKTNAIAAINGSYFNFASPRLDGQPIGLVLAQDRLLHAARGDRPVFEIDSDDRVHFALPHERRYNGLRGLALGRQLSVANSLPALMQAPEALRVRDALEGGPMLIHQGAVLPLKGFNLMILKGQEPRTAVGLTRQGKMVWITIDGRRPGHSMGTDLTELTQFFIALDAMEALNWDGGGSTTMVIRGKPITLIATGWVRAVSNALVLVPTATAGPAVVTY